MALDKNFIHSVPIQCTLSACAGCRARPENTVEESTASPARRGCERVGHMSMKLLSACVHMCTPSVILKKCWATRAGLRGLTPGGHKKASQDFLEF